MASRWSSEFVVAEHRDLQASAMTMDRDGINILLAGKRYIAIKNLVDSSDVLKKFPRHNKYDITTAEWNPTIANNHFCALSTQEKIGLACWREVDLHLAHTLRFHTRLVTDLNWHLFDCNILASASIDTFTHVWDIRDPRRPSLSFSSVASANHVRWNKLSSHLLATAVDGDIRIWDQRKGTAPIQYISAHTAKIHGLDWSQTHEYQLASCSQDCTVKFFDVTNPRCAESVIQTPAPVWRARYTPFGEGLVTVVVPQSRRGENSLLLWNLSNQSVPVHTFVGHTDIVLEFAWRKHRLDFSEYQLITWSKDQSLRIWRIEPFLQKLCGYDLDGDSQGLVEDVDSDIVHVTTNDLPCNNLIALPAVEAMNVMDACTLSDLDISQNLERGFLSPQDPSKSLELEFALLSTNFSLPNVKFEDMNVSNRSCLVTASVNSHFVSLQITFPPSYPYNAAPSFRIDDGSSVDSLLKTKLLKVLKQTAQQHARKNRTCLESCVLQLVLALEHTVQMQEVESKPVSRIPALGGVEPSLNPGSSYLYGSAHDSQIPYPRTCGARFCSVDLLVCFYRPLFSRRVSALPDTATPRSLSAVPGNMTFSSLSYPLVYVIPNDEQDTADGYYVHDRAINRNRGSRSGSVHMGNRSGSKSTKMVAIYECSKLFFIHKELGERYVFEHRNIAEMCHKNAIIAGSVGRQDLVQIWNLAALVASPAPQGSDWEDDLSWMHHPFSRAQIEHLIFHYAKLSDVQTAAMLCCAFANKFEHKGFMSNKNVNSKSVSATPGGSPYHTIHPADTSLEGWNYPTIKQNRSNSWSESLDELRFMANILEHREAGDNDYERSKILEEKNMVLYDELKRKYAELLHMWNLLEARAQVAKYLSTPGDPHRGVEFLTECQHCKKPVAGSAHCTSCKRLTLRCAVCRILVRGSSNFCLVCGHGGHTIHMMSWFQTESICPTGCGCKCLIETNNTLEN